jgi:hypothetical protein
VGHDGSRRPTTLILNRGVAQHRLPLDAAQPETDVAVEDELGGGQPRQSHAGPPAGVGEALIQPAFLDEHTAGSEHARNLAKRQLRLGYVVAGAEVEHDVERAVGERHLSDIAPAQSDRHLPGGRDRGRLREQRRVDVEASQNTWLTESVESKEGVSATAADFEDALAGRNFEQSH